MNAKTIRRGLAMLGIVAITGVTGLVYAAQASAEHRPQDGVHPKNSICFKDRTMVKRADIYAPHHYKLGKIELFYSPTCRTTWARIETLKPSGRQFHDYYATAFVMRNKGKVSLHQGAEISFAENGWMASNTMMVNDKNVTSHAEGYIHYKGQNYGATTGSF